MLADARHREGTSRQIKRAYQKSGPRVSEADIRRAQRGNELQQRAERIQKAERQRKVNQQKRHEKEQKDREVRKRMGIPEPAIGCVGPSQIRMSQFFGREGNRKEDEAIITANDVTSTGSTALASLEWNTLQGGDLDVEFDQPLEQGFGERNSFASIGRPASQPVREDPCSSRLGAKAKDMPVVVKDQEGVCKPQATDETVQKSNRTSQRRTDDKDNFPSADHNDIETHLAAHLSQAEVIVRIDEPWDEESDLVEDWNHFLVSNTQIEREISSMDGLKQPMSQDMLPKSSFSDLDFTDEELSDFGAMGNVETDSHDKEKEKILRSSNRLCYTSSHGFSESARPSSIANRTISKQFNEIEQSRSKESPHQTAINDRSSDFDDPELDDLLQEYPTSRITVKAQQRDSKVSRSLQPVCQDTTESLCYALPDDFLMSTQELREFVD
ncbi:MAG: hypothetical protein M1812_004432 [Candelaria pacifica]|nr:MAG: hypothetical protein M1812_004432 [Candelaria pacifica]